jgi:hypothetical protein
VGHNNITRCPSCAEEGHDRSGDNLSISIEDPRKYICWAGCTRDMIRAAVGCPRPILRDRNLNPVIYVERQCHRFSNAEGN